MAKMFDTFTVDLKTADVDYIITTPKQLAEAFTLWNRRFMESPDDFYNIESLGDYATAGDSQSKHLISLLKELNENPNVATTH